jgi:hypothetical protein
LIGLAYSRCRADPFFGIRELPLTGNHAERRTSARFVVVRRRCASLVEGVGLGDVCGDRGHFIVDARLDLLRLLKCVCLGDRLGALGQTSALLVGGHRFVRHEHSLARRP